MKNYKELLNNPLTIKTVSIFFIIILLSIPLAFVQSLINEREEQGALVREEVNENWGRAQKISGPILTIPYTKEYSGANIDEFIYLLPEELHVDGQVDPEKRYRGIYDVIVYNSQLQFSGQFKLPDWQELKIDSTMIAWDKISVAIGIPDMRGIRENIKLHWNQEDYIFKPSADMDDPIESSVVVQGNLLNPASKSYAFNFIIDINGSKDLQVIPVGEETKVKIASSWPDPKFIGAFLPEKYDISKAGFSAEWKMLSLNRNFPQQWRNKKYDMTEAAFGVEMLVPVDEYQKTTRSVKYGLLIIGLTFLVFFFVEMLNRKRVHPLQYTLVGLSLALFYLLLISIAEHTGFNLAFIISGTLISLMVFLYSIHLYQTVQLALYNCISLILMYSFVFITIQQQDFALLFGSICLFVILAVVMWVSRKINWYNKSEVVTG
ncbi:MAG: cell envelope integrity protein CreD [Cyclobacteriaceae bacterium]